MIWFVLAFPFIPSYVRGSDNQPTFTLIFLGIFLVILIKSNAVKIKFINSYGIVLSTLLILSFCVSIVYNIYALSKVPYFSRSLAFIQFIIAFIFGTSTLYSLPRNWLKNVLWIYAIFTFIYYLTGGIIEDFLIKSRIPGGSEALVETGRGARTLSPEPSIMAIHIFNIMMLNILTFKNSHLGFKTIFLVLISLLGSLSGYGFFLAVSLLLIYYPLFFIFTLPFSFLVLPFFFNIQSYNTRILYILKGLQENGIGFLLQDLSFSTRLDSFMLYLRSFVNTFPFGDAFTIFDGGGFISLISALGIGGFIFFLFILLMLFISNYSIRIKLLFFVWFLVYFISGSFGVPLFGLILGVFISNSLYNEKNIDIVSS
jgi:hypothetical protein